MIFRLVALLCAWLLAGSHAWTQVITPPPAFKTTPGYKASRFYPVGNGLIVSASAVPTLDTVVFLYPFTVYDYPLVAVSLNTEVVTGAVNCAIKMAVWATDPATNRPTGTPVVGSNTGQPCTGSPQAASVAVSFTFQPGVVYWAGTAVTTGAGQFIAFRTDLTPPGYGIYGQLGRTSMSSANTSALTAPYTYATDITALNLTGATFTDSTANGIPILFLGT